MAYPDLIRRRPTPQNELAASPTYCPSCSSATIVTAAKVPGTESYWRCLGCGEVWTPTRRQAQATGRWRP
jgi:predicted Zn finger-like uncharacterized protein